MNFSIWLFGQNATQYMIPGYCNLFYMQLCVVSSLDTRIL